MFFSTNDFYLCPFVKVMFDGYFTLFIWHHKKTEKCLINSKYKKSQRNKAISVHFFDRLYFQVGKIKLNRIERE